MKPRLHLRIYTHQIIEISYLQYDFDIIVARLEVRFDIFHKWYIIMKWNNYSMPCVQENICVIQVLFIGNYWILPHWTNKLCTNVLFCVTAV